MEEKDEKKEVNNDVTKTFEFKASLTLLCIVLGVMFVHQFLGWIGIHGNLIWFILNAVFSGVAIVEVIACAWFLTKVTAPKKNNDSTSFAINIVALIIACLNVLWWLGDMFVNLRGLIK